MILALQIFGFGFSSFMTYIAFSSYKKNSITGKELIGWLILWGTFFLLMINPRLLRFIIVPLRISRIIDFFVIFGFMFFAIIIYYNYLQQRHSQKNIEEIVRKISLMEEN